jgi:hypothetical protein
MARQTICDVCRQPIAEPVQCGQVAITTDVAALGDVTLNDVCLACWDDIKDAVLTVLSRKET